MQSALIETGLLEQPWLAFDGVRLSGPEGVAGFVRRLRHGWASWLLGPALAVHETAEEPLVCVVRRRLALWPSWAVEDSEGERVGRVARPLLRGRWGEGLARRDPDGAFRDGSGKTLAMLRNGRLEFGQDTRGEPFLRMLLLAALVTGG